MKKIVDEYFNQIDLVQIPVNSLSREEKLTYLSKIYLKHHLKFAYSNFALRKISLQHPVQRESLALSDYQQLLSSHHGYCLENAQLLFVILQSMGYEVHRCMARVLNGLRINSKELLSLPATHMILVVIIHGERFYLDPGLGPRSPRCPIKIDNNGEIMKQHYDQFRFYFTEGIYVLERLQAGSWVQLIQTDLKLIDDKQFALTMLKLERFPNTIGIRDCKTVVGKITLNGSRTLFWDNLFNKITYSEEDNGQYKKEVLTTDDAVHKLETDFALKGISKTMLQKMCTGNNFSMPNRRWSIGSGLSEKYLEEMSHNLKL